MGSDGVGTRLSAVALVGLVILTAAGCQRRATSLHVTNGCDRAIEVAVDTSDPREVGELLEELITGIDPGEAVGLDAGLSRGRFWVLADPRSAQPRIHEVPFTAESSISALTLSREDCDDAPEDEGPAGA